MNASVSWNFRGSLSFQTPKDTFSEASLGAGGISFGASGGVQPQDAWQPPAQDALGSEMAALELELELMMLCSLGGVDGVGEDGGAQDLGSASYQALGRVEQGQTKSGTDDSAVHGDPPADLAPPENETAGQIYSEHKDVFDDVNKMKWKGEKEGDIFAKNNGFKSFDDMKGSDSPEAAKAMAKLQWVGTAANNAGIQDSSGTHQRSAKLRGGGLTGIRGSGEVDPHSTAAIAQDYIVHGQSMNGKTTTATDRVYADGTCKSNAHMVMKKIGDAIGKVIPWVKLATDAGDNISDISHADKVGDKETADHDKKKFGKMIGDFFKEEAELAVTVVAPEVGVAAKAAELGVKLGTTLGRGAEEIGQAGRGAEEAGEGAGSVGRPRPRPEDPASKDRWDGIQAKVNQWLAKNADASSPTIRDTVMSIVREEFKEQLKDELKSQIHDALSHYLGINDPNQSQAMPNGPGLSPMLSGLGAPGGYAFSHTPAPIAAAG